MIVVFVSKIAKEEVITSLRKVVALGHRGTPGDENR